MATTLYFRSMVTDSLKIPLITLEPDDYTTTPLDRLAGVATTPAIPLSTIAGSSSFSDSLTTVVGPQAAPGLAFSNRFISPPLAADVTISGTIAADLWAYEGSMSANAAVGIVIWRVTPDGQASVIVSMSNTTELGTANTQMSMSATPTSTDCKIGDVILVGVYIDDASGTTMGNNYSVYFYFNAAEGQTADSQIRFTETLSFSSTPSGTTTNMLDDSSDLSGSGFKKLWTDTPSGQVSTITTTATNGVSVEFTQSSGGQTIRWFTPPLAAMTLAGPVDISLYGEGNGAVQVEIYKTDSDGSNPVLLSKVRGFAHDSYSTPDSWWGTGPQMHVVRASINTTLTNGQRLQVRLFTAATTFSLVSGDTTLYLENATYPSKITWPATLTQYTWPLIETFTDDFSTKDTLKWTWGSNDVSGGKANVAVGTSIYTNSMFSLKESSVYIDWDGHVTNQWKEIKLAPVSPSSMNYVFALCIDGSNKLSASHYSSTGGMISFYGVTYDPVTMKYSRIRYTTDTVYFEYSANASDWTLLVSWQDPVQMCYTIVLSTLTSTQTFEGVNVTSGPPPAAPTDYWGVAA